MDRRLRRPSARAALILSMVGLSLAWLTLACRPASAPPRPTPASVDAFAVVRATAEAAYQSGKTHLDRGELEPALIDLDTARTNDADNRQDIQQALAQTISRLAAETPTVAPSSVSRARVVATVPAAIAATPTVASAATAAAAATAASAATAAVPASAPPRPTTVVAPTLIAWRDPQGRFSVSAPADWATAEHVQALFGVGTGIVQFRDPSGRVELDVAVDSAASAVSPELYSASVELALQQQVPDYAAELTQEATIGGSPSLRRVFTFTQRDAAGQDYPARGFQLTLVKGSTPYVISGSAPADRFASTGPTLDQMVETFRFS
jgi:hypothetical protein